MSTAALTQYGLYALIAIFVIYRQFAPRPIRSAGQLVILPLLLTAYGAYSLLQSPPASAEALLVLGGGVLVGVGAGVARALTMKFWVNEGGVAMQRGTVLTLVVWIGYIAARIGSFFLFRDASGTSDLLLSVGSSLLVQALVSYLRGQALTGARTPSVTPGGYR